MPQLIVYCHTHNIYFKMSHGGEFTEPTFATDLNKFVLVNMIPGCTPQDVKADIQRQYSDVNAPLCITFAVSSLGMGVDCSAVELYT